jgi:FkbM family methyltransferase
MTGPGSAGSRALEALAALPLRLMGSDRRGRILQTLSAEMVAAVPAPGGPLSMSVATPLLGKRSRQLLSAEPDTIAWIDGFEPGDVLWDIGANVGLFSLYAARRPGVRVVAFEPSVDNLAILCRHIEMNELSDRITPYCIAMAGETGLGLLNSPFPRDVGASLHQFGGPGDASPWWSGTTTHIQGMVGFTIDDFLALFGPPFPNHIKLDVDGLEAAILAGAARTLRDPRLGSVMVEIILTVDPQLEAIHRLLHEAGFALAGRGEPEIADDVVGANHLYRRAA